MTQQQAQAVIDSSSEINSLDFDRIIQSAYPDRTDLENIVFSQINLTEFIHLSKKIFTQFIEEFQQRENTLILSNVYTHPQFGNAILESQIVNYFSLVNSNNLNGAEQYLLWLAGYQLEHGFYNKHTKKTSEVTASTLNKLSEKLNLIETNIQNKQLESEKLFLKLEESHKEINLLIAQKKEELQTITANLTTSNTQTTQISELLTKSTENYSRLNTILEQQETNKQLAEKKLVDLQSIYEKTNEEFSGNMKVASSQIEEFKKQIISNEEHLNFVEGKREFFEERIKYLDNLIGREVGVSLFETFKQRKTELQKPVLFWRWAVPIMSVATILWIFFLFSKQPSGDNVNDWWDAFAVNTLKSIPAIFLLLFAINQYRKERNFQEEYAFKSAVALTIDAYAGRIQDPVNKDKLIMDSVFNVYKTPLDEKQTLKIKSKTALEMIKSMSDATKDLIQGTRQ